MKPFLCAFLMLTTLCSNIFYLAAVRAAEAIAQKESQQQRTTKQTPSVSPDHIIRLPATGGCFTLSINKHKFTEANLNSFAVVGAVYDHIEKRTLYTGTLPFSGLQNDTFTNSTTIFSFAPVPDSVEFFLYVLKKDPVTKKISQEKPRDFLDILFLPKCSTTNNMLHFTQEAIHSAQKIWSEKGGSFRERAKTKWNSLTPSQKKAAKAVIIGTAAVVGATLSALAYKHIQEKRVEKEALLEEERAPLLAKEKRLLEEKKLHAKAELATNIGIPNSTAIPDSFAQEYITTPPGIKRKALENALKIKLDIPLDL